MSFLEKLRSYLSGLSENEAEEEPAESETFEPAAPKSGITKGEVEIEGVDSDEIVAVILAAVSDYTDIPLDELKITSIKAVE